MRKTTLQGILLLTIVCVSFLQSCKDDSYLITPPPVPDQSRVEEFDTLINAYNRGWRFINHSEPIGIGKWLNGGPPPYSGIGVIFTGFDAGNAVATLNNWAVSPPLIMQNGDKIVFYSVSAGTFADRLQVRISNAGDDLNVGTHADETGSFNITLLDINPNYDDVGVASYPVDWTRFEAKVYGLNGPTRGRFAFRYFVEDGGPAGVNSNGVAIDSVAYIGKK